MTNACAISCLISNRYIWKTWLHKEQLIKTAQQEPALYLQKLLESGDVFSALVKLDEHTGVECMGCRGPKHITQESYILGIPSPDSTAASYSRVRAVVQNMLSARVRFLPPMAVLKGKRIEELIWNLLCLHLQGICGQTFTAKMALPFWLKPGF